MAKGAGDVRASKWDGDIYTVGNTRLEYRDLPDAMKKTVQNQSKKIASAMYDRLKDSTVTLNAGDKDIDVAFTKAGCEHVSRDAMIILSGKYMSRNSMLHVDELLSRSTYVETTHGLTKGRKDGKEMFFRYKDGDGRQIYFKVAYEPNQSQGKKYYLYSVVDR